MEAGKVVSVEVVEGVEVGNRADGTCCNERDVI